MTGNVENNDVDLGYIKSQVKAVIENLKTFPFLQLFYIGLIVGGTWLLIFFQKIEYLPDFDFTSGTATLLGVAFWGMICIAVIGFYFTFPSYFLQMIWDSNFGSNKLLPSGKIYRSKQKQTFFLASLHQNLNALLVFLAWLAYMLREYIGVDLIIVILFLGVATVLNLICQVCAYQKVKCKKNRTIAYKIYSNYALRVNAFLFLSWLFVWLVLFVFFINSISDCIDKKEWANLGAIVVFFVFLVVVNPLIIKFDSYRRKLIFIFTLSLALVVIFAALPFPNLSIINAPLRILKLGDVAHVRMVVKKETCHEMQELNPMLCRLSKDEESGVISHVKIVSRIGNEFLIVDEIRKYPLRSQEPIVIKKEDVLKWTVAK